MGQITLRKFPYPYRAALSICSDIDRTSWDRFIAIHKFLNTSQETAMGPGLSLAIGNSFWMYDRPGLVDSAFSYFDNLTGKESKVAPMMREFIRAGILDVIHSYGNFAMMIDFSRKTAVQALETLQKHNLKINVWTNHGGIESIQNIGALSWGKGDIPVHEGNGTAKSLDCYHADLLIDYGIRFYWDSEDSLTSLVGQDAPVHFSEAYWKSPLYLGFKLKAKSIIKGYLSFADLFYYKLRKKHFVPWQPFDFQNNLIELDALRDGSPILKFKRFGHKKLVTSDDLHFLLNDRVLTNLLAKEGYLILYLQLGNQKKERNSDPLSSLTVQKLYQLADLYRKGKLWIQTSGRLLRYNWIYHHLKWSVTETTSHYRIQIEGLDTDIPQYDLTSTDLEGLTFETPLDKKVIITFNERPLSCTTYLDQEQHKQFIMIPLAKIEYPL